MKMHHLMQKLFQFILAYTWNVSFWAKIILPEKNPSKVNHKVLDYKKVIDFSYYYEYLWF